MTYEEIVKAYEDLSEDDKKKFHQTLKDRIDESVGEQEREDGDEDSQDAKDRVDESLGEEEKDLEEEETEAGDGDGDDAEEEAEETEKELEDHEADDEKMKKSYDERLDRIEKLLMKIVGEDSEAAEDVEKKAKEVYGLGGGTFAPEAGSDKKDKPDVRKVLRNLGL